MNLIPYPNEVEVLDPRCSVVRLDLDRLGLSDLSRRLPSATTRFLERLRSSFALDTLPFQPSPFARVDGVSRTLVFGNVFFDKVIGIPQFGDDESFNLTLQLRGTDVIVDLSAPTSTGVVRAFSVILQLLVERSRCVPIGLRIADAPAHAWRGLMLDPARRFIDLERVKRVCLGLEMSRMNVLHLHLTDDQGWRFESRIWPQLHESGTLDGQFYSQRNLSDLVSFCAVGGVRVVPEINIPGHCGAALFAMPEMAPDHHPKTFVSDWGIFDFALDFSRVLTQQVVRDVLNEVMSVFPDAFVHVGGDEVVWPTFSSTTLAWMALRNLSAANLQQFVQERFIFPTIVTRGRRVLAWSEVWSASRPFGTLPAGTGIQWWTSMSRSETVTSVISAGLYLDRMPSPEELYAAPFLTASDDGGEACLWGEVVGDNLETRIFPGLLALAEVLWRGSDRRLSVNSMLLRTFVQDVGTLGSPVTGLIYRRMYKERVERLGSNDTLIVDVLLPTSVWAPISDTFSDVLDATRTTSPFLQMLVWLSGFAADQEQFDQTRAATRTLVQWLSELADSTPQSFGPSMERHRLRLSADARALLNRIGLQRPLVTDARSASSNFDGEEYFAGVFSVDKFVWNGLKRVVEPVILSKSVVPINQVSQPSSSSLSTLFESSTQGAATTSATPSSPSEWVGIIIGSLVVVVVFGLLIVGLLVHNTWTMRKKRLAAADSLMYEEDATPMLSARNVLSEVAVVSGGDAPPVMEEHYLDYIEEDDDDEDEEILFIRRVSSDNEVTEVISVTEVVSETLTESISFSGEEE